jgi:hypothetical protein
MSRTIEIIVSPQGETRLETKGFSGANCQQASRFLEQALGQQVEQQLTLEYFHFQSTMQSQQQRS